jgi:arylsulfatase A-like enzyme
VTTEVATAMDLFPTLAGLCGAPLPTDRTIDGRDITPLLLDPAATSPHEAFLYYFMDDLEAVRSGRWKLHFAKHGEAVSALYDLAADPGETTDVRVAHPDVVAELEAHAEQARRSLGDARLDRVGAEVRPIGRVPGVRRRTLTTYDPTHPYYAAEYDLPHRG